MTHEELMNHAVKLATAFIQNGDLRHCGNFRDDGSSVTQEQVQLLVMQMYNAVEQAAHETRDITDDEMAEINLDAAKRHGLL